MTVQHLTQPLTPRLAVSGCLRLTDKNFNKNVTVLHKLNRLVGSGCKNLFFQYSGHGTQIQDINGDEPDGLDESLYTVGGDIITDDEINESIKRVPKNSTIYLFIYTIKLEK